MNASKSTKSKTMKTVSVKPSIGKSKDGKVFTKSGFNRRQEVNVDTGSNKSTKSTKGSKKDP